MTVNIIHHGAGDGVTGSCHQLFVDGEERSVLVDCGLFQGAETSADGVASAEQLEIGFAVERIAALVLTHVHVDHCGRLPWLLAAGFKGPIVCSEPSARLLPVVLADAFQLGISRRAADVERYLQLVEGRLRPLPYRQWLTLYDSAQVRCRVRLQRAGHILGSAYAEFELSGAAWPQRRRVLFSGDLGAPWAPLLPAPQPPWQADVVVLESTYGDRLHPDRRQRRARLQAVVERALSDGGTVIMPAFSIGRTQELLYEFEDILHQAGKNETSGDWGRLKIFLDSPLASRFTALYRELQPFWDAEAKARVRSGRQPLDFAQLQAIDDHAAHLAN
ncbi:MAG: MBL fold metallo-hydrolase, partial [Thauera sp.]|nr:MBL fold metallo-hydrolase [Thauera sp.]